MNHSCIATIFDSGIKLSSDLLIPLGILHGSSVTGLYYPRPRLEAEYKDLGITHDIMLTSIPLDWWPLSGRIKLRYRMDVTDALPQI
ncbi:MAG: hypothetical protein AAFX85_21005, partial [Pseudomonadota bacterium]